MGAPLVPSITLKLNCGLLEVRGDPDIVLDDLPVVSRYGIVCRVLSLEIADSCAELVRAQHHLVHRVPSYTSFLLKYTLSVVVEGLNTVVVAVYKPQKA